MKKFLKGIAVALACVTLYGCSGSASGSANSAKVKEVDNAFFGKLKAETNDGYTSYTTVDNIDTVKKNAEESVNNYKKIVQENRLPGLNLDINDNPVGTSDGMSDISFGYDEYITVMNSNKQSEYGRLSYTFIELDQQKFEDASCMLNLEMYYYNEIDKTKYTITKALLDEISEKAGVDISLDKVLELIGDKVSRDGNSVYDGELSEDLYMNIFHSKYEGTTSPNTISISITTNNIMVNK